MKPFCEVRNMAETELSYL